MHSSDAAKRPSHPAPNTRDDREAPLLERRGTRGNLPVICPSSQAKLPATFWHDGQITCRAQNAVKRNLLLYGAVIASRPGFTRESANRAMRSPLPRKLGNRCTL